MQKRGFFSNSISAHKSSSTRDCMQLDYTTFGSPMIGRSYQADTSNGYRYKFNGKETDAETDLQDYGMRIYNGDLGRFLSLDPIMNQYPELTPYQFSSNTPIECIDIDGLEKTRTKTGFQGMQMPVELSDNNALNKPLIKKN